MQFRISFASLVTGFIIVCMTFGVITTMILDLNTAADDDQMHSENLRIRSELDSMQVETRELQRQIELLQAYSLHIDISTEELETPPKKSEKKANKKRERKNNRTNEKKETKNKNAKPSIFIEVQKEEPPNENTKNEIFIDVSSDQNSSKKK